MADGWWARNLSIRASGFLFIHTSSQISGSVLAIAFQSKREKAGAAQFSGSVLAIAAAAAAAAAQPRFLSPT